MLIRASVAAALLCLAGAAGANEIARGVAGDTAPAAQALGALNAACTITTVGQTGVGFQLAAGTLVGTIVPELSYDSGSTWVATFFDDPTTGNPASSIVFGSSNTATARTIHTAGGVSSVRVRVSAFTSGTANCSIRGSTAHDPSNLFEAVAGAPTQTTVQIGGKDGSGNVQPAVVKAASTAAAATDPAIVVAVSPNNSVAVTQATGTNLHVVTDATSTLAANQSVNASQIGGTNTVNGGVAGTLGVGGTQANNAGINANPVLVGGEAITSQPAAATTGNIRRIVTTLDGVQYHRGGGPVSTSFNVISTATTIQTINTNLAGASLSYYIDDIDLYASAIATTTADQLLEIKQCTTAACGGTCTVVIACSNAAFGGCSHAYQNPVKTTANTCLCWMNAVTGTKWITVSYHVAP